MAEKIAIVTGSNKGLGFAIVKNLCERFSGAVYLTARDERRGLRAVELLSEMGYKPRFHTLDVTDKLSIIKFAQFIKAEHGGVDVLVNNAAILEWEQVYPTYEAAKRNIDTNYRSVLDIEEFLYPLLRDGARVVNVSSMCGHLSNLRDQKWLKLLNNRTLSTEVINHFVMDYLNSVENGTFDKNKFADEGKHAEHRVSKIALTALTKVQQAKYEHRDISINAVHPGHVRTDMAQGGGELEPDAAAGTVVYLALDAPHDVRGAFVWPDRALVDWYDVGAEYYYKHGD